MKKLNRIGERYITKEGYNIEIIKYLKDSDCSVKFDNGLIKHNITFSHIKNGKIKNPYHLSVYGVGYLGVGTYSVSTKRKAVKSYNVWNSMLQRCYDKDFQKKQSSYEKCYVAKNWHNYQNFAEWFNKNYIEGFELDKDILIKGNKIYSPETCCFIPQEINQTFTIIQKKKSNYPPGVRKDKNKFSAQMSTKGKNKYLGMFNTIEEASIEYNLSKEKHIKSLANKYKNTLSSEVYNILINYKL